MFNKNNELSTDLHRRMLVSKMRVVIEESCWEAARKACKTLNNPNDSSIVSDVVQSIYYFFEYNCKLGPDDVDEVVLIAEDLMREEEINCKQHGMADSDRWEVIALCEDFQQKILSSHVKSKSYNADTIFVLELLLANMHLDIYFMLLTHNHAFRKNGVYLLASFLFLVKVIDTAASDGVFFFAANPIHKYKDLGKIKKFPAHLETKL